jgi:peptide chain release factor subunit 1
VIATRDLRQLAAFTGLKAPVLSLYLDTDLSRNQKEQVKLTLRDLLEQARGANAPEDDLTRVTRYVDLEYDWQGKGLIVFSCLADGLWELYPLPVPVQSHVYVGDKAYLMPLSNLLDRYAPYGVALVGQEGARLFLIDMGGIVREENTIGEPIKRHKQGGWSAPRFQRHVEKHAAANLKAAAESMARFCAANDCSRVILAGTEENTARFFDLLPTSLRQSVEGTIALDVNAAPSTVVERSREILDDLEEERERELVDRLITTRHAGGPAATGLADTLFTLQEGRVLTLLVEDGFAAPGFVCPGCDYLSIDETEHCLFCGTANARQVGNIVEYALHKAFVQGATIRVIPSGTALTEAGQIGALLRY